MTALALREAVASVALVRGMRTTVRHVVVADNGDYVCNSCGVRWNPDVLTPCKATLFIAACAEFLKLHARCLA